MLLPCVLNILKLFPSPEAQRLCIAILIHACYVFKLASGKYVPIDTCCFAEFSGV